MKTAWSDTDRETAYTALCHAVSEAGADQETHFLARLAVLLAEALGDLDVFSTTLAAATLHQPPDEDADEPGRRSLRDGYHTNTPAMPPAG